VSGRQQDVPRSHRRSVPSTRWIGAVPLISANAAILASTRYRPLAFFVVPIAAIAITPLILCVGVLMWWFERYAKADADGLANLYAEDALQ
jgi:hypothetical protein